MESAIFQFYVLVYDRVASIVLPIRELTIELRGERRAHRSAPFVVYVPRLIVACLTGKPCTGFLFRYILPQKEC